MGLMPDAFELEQKKKQEELSRKVREARKKAFIKKWLSSSPEEQAEIVFNIMEATEEVGNIAAAANFHHMRF